MGLFDKALKDVVGKTVQNTVGKNVQNAVGKGIQNAVGKAVEGAVRPAADKLAGKAVETVSGAAEGKLGELKTALGEANTAMAEANAAMGEAQEAAKGVSEEQWNQAFSLFEGMANNMMKDLKVCPACEEPIKGDVKFCPKCGAKLPELTVTQMALCPKCGKQNAVGTDFCTDCGAKLPYREVREEAQRTKDAAILAKWGETLPQFPTWDCGGGHFDLCELEEGRFCFSAWFDGDGDAAQQSVRQYRARLKEAGFQKAGQYPSEEHLYKMSDGICCHADTEHCFEGDSDAPSVYFLLNDEPTGGFHYVKPEPKKKSGGLLGSLFG